MRLALGGAILTALLAYYAVADRLPNAPLNADVAFTVLVLMPTTLALVLLLLPLREARGVAAVGVALAVLAATLVLAGFDVPANFAKLAAVTLLALWFLGYFERPSWIILVAALVPWVDAISVWRGPTHQIITERPKVFDALAFAFPLPGGEAFELGLTDLAFFALFLGGAARWGFRVGWTWVALVAGLGATIALTVWVDPFGLGGLPALPGLSFGFLAANADHVVRVLRRTDERIAVTLPVSDPGAALRFYREVAGARARTDDGRVRVVADWAAGGELGFLVHDIGAAHERALRAGAPVVVEPRVEDWGRTASYRDPDGRVVVLTEPR